MYSKSFLSRLLAFILVSVTVFGFVAVDVVAASPHPSLGVPSLYLADAATPPEKDLITKLETEILPQLHAIFSPEQLEQFQADLAEGVSFRKAFKSLMLTPEQKTQIKTVLQSASKDALASLTPEQKKQLFSSKKKEFMPTSDEISEKVAAKFKEKGLEVPAGLKEKIDSGFKRKDSFIPSFEDITDKIEDGIDALKEKFED